MARILVVDDDRGTARAIGVVLMELGHVAMTSGSGGEALILVKGRVEFELIITDTKMPEMSGIELATKIRGWERESGTKETPILLCSADEPVLSSEELDKAGINAFMSKPFNIDELEELIESLIA